MIRGTQTLLVLLALAWAPATARSIELFEGNLGYNGDWLHVVDAATMDDRVYWYDMGDAFTYEVEFSVDDLFSSPLATLAGIETNYLSPGLDPGFYYLRVRAMDALGGATGWSNTGTLEVVEDLESPTARILYPADGQTFSQGEIVSIQLEVADDTVLHIARFIVDGAYAGVLGLKAENNKLRPSLGEPRTVTFDYQIPSTGGTGPIDIAVLVYDVTYKTAVTGVVVNTSKSTTTDTGTTDTGTKSNNGRGKGRR